MAKGDPKDKKKGNITAVNSGLDGGSQQVASNGGDDNSATAPGNTDVAAVGGGGSMVPSSAFNKTAEEESVQDHPKGCGCVAAGLGGESLLGGGAGLLGLGLAVAVRRRSRR